LFLINNRQRLQISRKRDNVLLHVCRKVSIFPKYAPEKARLQHNDLLFQTWSAIDLAGCGRYRIVYVQPIFEPDGQVG
jgi:hypothetical protein